MNEIFDLLKEAQNAHKLGELDLALKLYMEVLDRDPKNITALTFVGTINHQLQNFLKAKTYLERAYLLNPKSMFVVGNYLNLLHELDELTEHQDVVKTLLDTDSRNPAVLTIKGNISRLLKQYPAALNFYDLALALDPTNYAILNNRGHLKATMGLWPGAVRDLTKIYKGPMAEKFKSSGLRSTINQIKAADLIRQIANNHTYDKFVGSDETVTEEDVEDEYVAFYCPLSSDDKKISTSTGKENWDYFLEIFPRWVQNFTKRPPVLLTHRMYDVSKLKSKWSVKQYEFDAKKLMYSRLLCQLKYLEERSQVRSYFCDLDLIRVNKTLRLNSKVDVFLTYRNSFPLINGGLLIANPGNGANHFFRSALELYQKFLNVSEKLDLFHGVDYGQWWGDQLALGAASDALSLQTVPRLDAPYKRKDNISLQLISAEKYNFSPTHLYGLELIHKLNEKEFVHFKGELTQKKLDFVKNIADSLILH